MPFPRQINRENLRFLRNRTDFSYKISEIFEKIRIFVDKITKLNEKSYHFSVFGSLCLLRNGPRERNSFQLPALARKCTCRCLGWGQYHHSRRRPLARIPQSRSHQQRERQEHQPQLHVVYGGGEDCQCGLCQSHQQPRHLERTGHVYGLRRHPHDLCRQ